MNEFLKISDFPEDKCLNGLQVHASDLELEKIALAVDASIDGFDKAKKQGCDMVIVHHGMYWKGVDPLITGPTLKRVRFLLDKNMSLYAAHLPLDAHRTIGNQVEIIKKLGFKPHKVMDKVRWTCRPNKGLEDIVSRVTEKIGAPLQVLKFGDDEVKELVVSSGGSADAVFTAPEGSTILLGEFQHYGYHYAKERQLNIIEAGHYATERFGLIGLGRVIEDKFKIPTVFVDVPTNM